MIKKIKPFVILLAFATLAFNATAQQVSPNEINKKFGINFLKDANLWDDSATDFMKRLGAKFQDTDISGGKIHSTFAKGKILSAEIEQLRFIEKNGKVTQVDMVFFNKGDSATGKKWTSKLQREMKKQWDTIEASLDSFAGKSEKGMWGEGRIKNKAQIWKFQNYVFSLEVKPKEFIILHITNPEAKKSSKAGVTDDFDGKANVVKEDNGDVWIKNIPMTNQGAKGYCTPATIERCLKYYAIPNVDMHKIAAICKTQIGGGTNIDNVMSNFRQVCSAFKLRMQNVRSLSMNSISNMIDKGIPICWSMFSTNQYYQRMINNTAKRKNANFDAYCDEIKKQDKIKKVLEGAHTCLIIGYNKTSKELAVSNSWGDNYEITWVRFEDAKIVSRNLFVINPR